MILEPTTGQTYPVLHIHSCLHSLLRHATLIVETCGSLGGSIQFRHHEVQADGAFEAALGLIVSRHGLCDGGRC